MAATATFYEGAVTAVRRIYDSRIDGPPVLPMADFFPEGQHFAAAWRAIRREALAAAADLNGLPRFHEIMPEQADISANDGRDWRLLLLKAYGVEMPRNLAACPVVAALLQACPDVLSASVSFLAPGKVIPEHRGPVRGILRFYMPLVMPRDAAGRPAAVLTVAGREHRLEEGEALLWDDTFPHAVHNASASVRAVLLMDVWRRGMPADMRAFSRVVVWVVRAGIRMRGMPAPARRVRVSSDATGPATARELEKVR